MTRKQQLKELLKKRGTVSNREFGKLVRKHFEHRVRKEEVTFDGGLL